MLNKKTILAAASILALTAGMAGPANASFSISLPDVKADRVEQPRIELTSDPLFDFSVRCIDMQSPAMVESALMSMFDDPSREQVEGFPAFLASMASLGLSPEILRLSKEVLIGIAASASSVDDELRRGIVSELEMGSKPIKLAQQRTRRPREPDTTGQVPGGGGGGGTGGGYR